MPLHETLPKRRENKEEREKGTKMEQEISGIYNSLTENGSLRGHAPFSMDCNARASMNENATSSCHFPGPPRPFAMLFHVSFQIVSTSVGLQAIFTLKRSIRSRYRMIFGTVLIEVSNG
jgi:hypothetical protein